jgi:hypothetical protein
VSDKRETKICLSSSVSQQLRLAPTLAALLMCLTVGGFVGGVEVSTRLEKVSTGLD